MKTTYLSFTPEQKDECFVDHSQATPDDVLITQDGRRHKFIQILGTGKSGTAYLFSGNIVVKGFRHNLTLDPDLVASAQEEAKIFNKLYEKEFGKAEVLISKSPFAVRLIMPQIPGVTLSALFNKYNQLELFKNENEIDLLKFLLALLEPLLEIKKDNIQDNDLNAQNILIDIHGKCRLIDFGSSRLLDDLKEEERSTYFYRDLQSIAVDFIEKCWLKRWPFPKTDSSTNIYSQLQKIVRYMTTPICQDPEADYFSRTYTYPTIENAIEQIDHLLDELKCTDKSVRFFEPYVIEVAKTRGDLYIDPDSPAAPKFSETNYLSPHTNPCEATKDDILVTHKSKHHFIKTLGSGKGGTAYLFSDNIVVKSFRCNESTQKDPDLVAHAHDEAKIFNKLYGKEFGEAEVLVLHNPFTVRLIMPQVPGVPLATFNKYNPLDLIQNETNLLKYIRAILAALLEIKENNISHGNVHYKHLLIDTNGKCRLIGFGRSRLLNDLKEEERAKLFYRDIENVAIDCIEKSWIKQWPFPKSDNSTKICSQLRKIVRYMTTPICQDPEADYFSRTYTYPTIENAIEQIDHLLDELKCTDKSTHLFESYVKQVAQERDESKTISAPSRAPLEQYPSDYYSIFKSHPTPRGGAIALLHDYVEKSFEHKLPHSEQQLEPQVDLHTLLASLNFIKENTSRFPDAVAVLNCVNKNLQISKYSKTSSLYKRLNFLKEVVSTPESAQHFLF